MDDRTEHEVSVGERAWTALTTMASQLSTEPGVLLNQALFTFARVNGYLAPSPLALAEPAPLPPPMAEPAPQPKAVPPRPQAPEAVRVGGAAAAATGPEPEPAPDEPEEEFARTIPRAKVPPPRPVLWLQAAGRRVKVTGERFVAGRGTSCQLVVDTKRASREHSAFVLDKGRWVVEDLRSSNGTWVNQKKVTRAELMDGDVVLVGDVEVTVHLE